MAVTAAAKLILAWRFPGFLTGDDLEIVQTAAKYALGVEYHPWELRCLFHPIALVWPALKLAALAGARDAALVTWVCALPNVAVSSAGIVMLYALARRWGWPVRPSLAAAFLYAVAWMPFAYGATPYPRPMSATALIAPSGSRARHRNLWDRRLRPDASPRRPSRSAGARAWS